MNLKKFLENKNIVVNTLFVNPAIKMNLSLTEFLILIYFDNLVSKEFDIKQLVSVLKVDENAALVAFNHLIEKKLLSVNVSKNGSNKINEYVNLDGFYSIIEDTYNQETKKQEKVDIFSAFEKEFARPISSMEYEIINAWLDKSFTEELILCALKEAIYNGVTNLRYIDKILYEWQRKGIKTGADVEKNLVNRSKKKDNQNSDELFDYNWLEENND